MSETLDTREGRGVPRAVKRFSIWYSVRLSVVPPGLASLSHLYPALKRWAKLGRPCGAGSSASEGLPVGGGPGGFGGYAGHSGFQARLLGQEAHLQVGEEMLQFFQVAAIIERFFFQRCGCCGRDHFGMLRAAQAFRRLQKLGE